MPMVQATAERVSSAPVFRQVPIAQIHITQNNFRKDFNDDELQELVESIRSKGIVQNLLVRAWPEGPTRVSEDLSQEKRAWRVWRGPYFGDSDVKAVDITGRLSQAEANKQRDLLENFDFALIAGERRLRAAKILGLKEVPCMVHECDDATVEELMIIENMQRKDLHDLEYADGFAKMINEHGYTVEELSRKLNKGTTYIRDFLHLGKLPAAARQAFRNGAISKSVCVLIGTVPDEKRRAEFAKQVLHTNREPMSFRAAKEWKERHYMRELKGAPFPLDDPTLDPEFGYTCTKGSCPHWNGNTPQAWQGKRADICLNPDHYTKLVQLSSARKIAEIVDSNKAETGKVNVLPPDQGEKLFYNSGHLRDSSYVDSTDTVHDYREGKSNQTVAAIVKQTGMRVTITTDCDSKVRTLVKRADLSLAIKRLGIKTTYSSNSRSKTKPSVSDEKKEAAAKCRTVAATALLNKVRAFNWTAASIKPWRDLALVFFQSWFYGDGAELLLPILGMPAQETNKRNAAEKFLRGYLATLKTVSEVHGLIAACVVADRMETYTTKYSNGFEKQDLALGMLFRVDLKAIQARAANQLSAAEKAEKKKASAKPKTKAKAA